MANTKSILITVSSITEGSGLSKYVCNLAKVLGDAHFEVSLLTTHSIDIPFEKKMVEECHINQYRSFSSYSKFVKYAMVLKYIRSLNPDVIINNYNGVIQYLLPFLPKSIKIAHVLHSTTPEFYRIATINAKRVNGWVAPTTAMVNDFNAFTRDKFTDKISVIPHGVECVLSEEVKPSKILELVFVGVLYEHKGAHLLPQIVKRLKSRGERFHLTIIGGGVLKEQLEHELSDELHNNLVKMTGVISSEDVYSYLSRANVFIYPTHIDSFGLVIAEAMMNGVVPVVTLLPGITDNLVDDGGNGYLIEKDNIDKFVETICSLLHNDVLLNQLSDAAILKAKSHFSLRVMQQNYTNYIENLK